VTGSRSISISVTGAAKAQRVAQVAGEHAAKVIDELHRDRLVQPHALHESVADDVGGLFAQHSATRVARNQAAEQKRQKEDSDQDRNGEDDAPKNVDKHYFLDPN
jgi:hypothetical protein